MSRISGRGTPRRHCERLGPDDYRCHTAWDHYYPGDRKRYPRGRSFRATEKGARRWCARWGVRFPEA